MKHILLRWLPYVLIFIFALVFTNSLFLHNLTFYGEEQGFLNYDYVNFRHFSIWDWSEHFGSIFASGFFNIFTAGFIWKVGQFFNLSNVAIQKIYYFIFIFATTAFGFAAFKLLSKNTFISLTASILYITTYHFYAVLITSPKLIHFLLIPSSLYFWLAFIQTKKWRYVVLNTFVLVACFGIGINPPQLLGAYSFIFFYILCFHFNTKDLKYAVIFFIPFILNFLLVFGTNYLQISYTGALVQFNQFEPAWSATSSKVYEVLRLFGGWWDYAGNKGLTYNHLFDFYHNNFSIALSYIPIIVLLIFIIKQPNNKRRIPFILFFLISLFWVKGAGAPFGLGFNLIYEIPFFKIFREPWAKFMPNFIFVIYLGIVMFYNGHSGRNLAQRGLLIQNLIPKTKKSDAGQASMTNNNNNLYIILILLLLLIFQLIPLVHQNAFDHRNTDWKMSDVTVPQYWYDLKNWTEKNAKQSRVLVLPINRDPEATFDHTWKPYIYRGSPELFFLYANYVNGRSVQPETQFVLDQLLDNMGPRILSIAAVDYVLIQNDITTNSRDLITFNAVKDGLDTEHKKSFGKLDLYPVKKEFQASKIHTVNSIINSYKACDLLKADNEQSSVIVKADKEFFNIHLASSSASSRQINETAYEVTIKTSDASKSALLFNSMYNNGWQLFKDLEAQQPIQATHTVANCYANLWVIDSDQLPKSNKVYLLYTPQKQFELLLFGWTASLGLYLVLTPLYLSFFHKRKKRP